MTRLSVAPLTRVEGHGEVELIIKDGRLVDARVCLTESPRLFESLVTGHRFDEVPDLICRICAICSAVHKLTALKTVEGALKVRVPPVAELIRELLLLGGHIQSHALHLFLLVLPDFFAVESALPLLQNKHPLTVAGLSLKAFGNRLQEVMGGRVIHPVNPVFGGVAHRPGDALLDRLAEDADQWCRNWSKVVDEFLSVASYPSSDSACGTPLALSQDDGFTLSGLSLCCGHDNAVPVTEYAVLLDEHSAAHTFAKLSGGAQGTAFLTGALARQILQRGENHRNGSQGLAHGIHANNMAQLQEIGWALEMVRELLAELKGCGPGEPLRVDSVKPGGGIGTAAMEAPRGLLVHHYVIDEWGTVVAADVVTPTAINQKSMSLQILADLEGERDHEVLRATTERIVRSYDPCISCAVHILEC